MPPAASEVWASSFGRLPTARTSTPASATSIAALRPDPPVPMTSTEVEIECSLRRAVPCVVFMASTLGSPNTYVQCIVRLKLIAVCYRHESRTAAGFVEVAATGHFTKAAAALHLAQPSLSRQISTLEKELGAELFHRARGHISLTAAGQTLLPTARRMLADAEAVRRDMD